MTGPRSGDEFTVEQLLQVLQDRFVSALLNKPPDLTLDEARIYTQRINDILIHARRLENSFQPVARAPPEILSVISSYLTEEELFSASQFCHYWRSVLISAPSLWTYITCRRASRTLASLNRSKPVPIRLRLEPPFSNSAPKAVLLHGSAIASLEIIRGAGKIPLLPRLFMLSRQPLERLCICAGGWEVLREGWGPPHDFWDDLPSLRELFIYQHPIPIVKLKTPNLVHLAIELAEYQQTVTLQAVFDMLRGCPLLQTFLLSHSDVLPQDTAPGHASVCLPHLHSIELGEQEVHSGLVTSLQFHQNITVGFRMIPQDHLYDDPPPTLIAAIQHVSRRIDIRSIALTTPISAFDSGLLIRFEGPGGSLEITTNWRTSRRRKRHVLLALERILSSPLPGIQNVTELHLVGYPSDGSEEFHHINAALQNVVSISFLCFDDHHMLRLLSQTHNSLPSFPRLERIMSLGRESGLERIASIRKKLGVPLKVLVLGQGPRSFKHSHLEDYTVLRGLVDDLRVGCPTEILEWGTGNEILNICSPIKVPGIFADVCKVFKSCRFNVSG